MRTRTGFCPLPENAMLPEVIWILMASLSSETVTSELLANFNLRACTQNNLRIPTRSDIQAVAREESSFADSYAA